MRNIRHALRVLRRLSPSVLLAAAFLLILGLSAPDPAKSTLPAGSPLLLADVIHDDSASEFADTLKPLLSLVLEQSMHFWLYPESRVRDSLKGMSLDRDSRLTKVVAREVCLREGIPAFLLPRFGRMGDTLLLSVRLIEVGDSGFAETPLDMIRAGDEGELLFSVEDLGKRLCRALGEGNGSAALTASVFPHPGAAGTRALQLFAKSLRPQAKKDQDGKRALLTEAVASDPGFALAQFRLGACLGQSEEALPHLAGAIDNATTLPPKERYRLWGAYYCLQGQYLEAAEQYAALARIYPHDWNARFELAHIFLGLRDFRHSIEQFQEAVRLEPGQADSQLGLSLSNLLDQNLDAARAALTVAVRLEPDNPQVLRTGGLLDLVNNEVRSATEAFEKLVESPSPHERSQGNYLLAQAQIYAGRFQAALATLDSGIEKDRLLGFRSSEAEKRLCKARLLWILRDFERSAHEGRKVEALTDDAAALASLGAVYARLGLQGDAERLLDRIGQAPPNSFSAIQALTLQGELRLAAGDFQDAVRLLTDAKKLRLAAAPSEPLARALLQAQRWDEAAEEYRTVQGRKAEVLFPPHEAWFTGTWVRSLYDAATCQLELGHNQEARQYLRSYLWVLEGADTTLPSHLEARSLMRKIK